MQTKNKNELSSLQIRLDNFFAICSDADEEMSQYMSQASTRISSVPVRHTLDKFDIQNVLRRFRDTRNREEDISCRGGDFVTLDNQNVYAQKKSSRDFGQVESDRPDGHKIHLSRKMSGRHFRLR